MWATSLIGSSDTDSGSYARTTVVETLKGFLVPLKKD